MAKQDYLDRMIQRVQDTDARLSSDDFDRALSAAVVRFSKDRPREHVGDWVSDGSVRFALPAEFDPEFSRLVAIEYPVGEFRPCLLDQDQYRLDASPDDISLLLADAVPLNEKIRVTWTGLHTVSELADTIHNTYIDAVSDWAASLLCHDLATLYSGDSDPTINADSVDHNGKAREFASRSNKLAQRYWDALGINPKRNVSTGAVVNMDVPIHRGRGRLLANRVLY